MSKTDDEGKVFAVVVMSGLLIWLAVWAIGALVAYTTSFYGYLSSLSGTPWWLVPVATLLALAQVPQLCCGSAFLKNILT